MNRDLGIMSRLEVLRGSSNLQPATRADTHTRDRINRYFPSESLLAIPKEPDPLDTGATFFSIGVFFAVIAIFGIMFLILRAIGL